MILIMPSAPPGDVGSSNLFLGHAAVVPPYVSLWPAVDALVRARLQQTADVVPDSLLDPIVGAYAGYMLSQYPCVGPYSGLANAELAAFNYALSLIVAASARPWLPKSTSTGELIHYTQGNTTYGYSHSTRSNPKSVDVLGRQAGKTIEQEWLDEAWQMLRQVSCIGAAWASMKSSFHIYAQNGARRRQEKAGYVHIPGGNPLYPILIADIFSWRDLWGLK